MILGDASLMTSGAVGAAGISPAPAALPDAFLPAIGAASSATYEGPLDRFGAITIPTSAPAEGEAPGDPTLSTYLAFFKAWLQSDANVAAVWNAMNVAPGQPAVVGAHAHNPSDALDDHRGVGFNTSDLPALYLFRGKGTEEWVTEDWLVDTSTVTLLWVFPLGVQSRQRARQPFANAMAKAVIDAIEIGRTPSFVVDGDPDPLAATFGSFVHTFTRAMSMRVVSWERARVELELDGGRTERYPAVQVTIEIEEQLEFDPTRWSAPAAISSSVTSGAPQLPGWAPSTVYVQGAVIAAGPGGQYVYRATATSGDATSGAAPPAWPTTASASVADHNVTWTCLGSLPATSAVVSGQA